MTVITTRLTVRPDGSVSLAGDIPAGEYLASIEVMERPPRQEPTKPFDIKSIQSLDLGPWPSGVGLSREELYGDDDR